MNNENQLKARVREKYSRIANQPLRQNQASCCGATSSCCNNEAAAAFFLKRAYTIVRRNEGPPFIQQTSGHASTCPSSATRMKKELA